jgi:DNA polymerase-3 subunit gamma/tau
MLKTLEEPPEYLKFVLATTDPQKVPVTVLSRCLQFNLRPMAPETVLEHLTQVLGRNVPAEPQALRLLARAARGSMRDALSLTDQAIAFGSGSAAGSQRAPDAGQRGPQPCVPPARGAGARRRQDGGETSEALRLNGLSAASTLEEMTAVLQRMAVLQAVPEMGEDATMPTRMRRDGAPGRPAAGRRNPAALQPVPARPRRAGPGARRIRGPDHGAAAAAGLQASAAGMRGVRRKKKL